MSEAVRTLNPPPLWNHFADLNAVPRPSKREERAVEFTKSFGQSLDLETMVDEAGNVIIRKPATPGMEDRVPVVLQAHLDMVHQKNNDTDFDFESQGIDMIVDGDFVKAAGTTLGADNGIGVASIMAILASSEIPHPPLEGLFTVDEETGMTGAKQLRGGLLKGKILLNLDTEEDSELTIGCAGGVDVTSEIQYQQERAPAQHVYYELRVKGLKGGHSGMDIHCGRGNANKWMNRLLWHAVDQCQVKIVKIDGGGLRNAIPRESVAVITVDPANAKRLATTIRFQTDQLKTEYQTTDPGAEIQLEAASVDGTPGVMNEETQRKLLASIYACPCGIYRMSPHMAGLVQTSNNLARVLVEDGNATIGCLTRSSADSERDDVAIAIAANFRNAGATSRFDGAYTGWTPRPDATIVKLMSELYQELFGEPAHVAACHAGLECGILGQNYPDMEMISFGPNIRGAHSPDERVQISSVEKYWKFLTETLKRIPVAA